MIKKLAPVDLGEALRSERTIQAATDDLHIAEHRMEAATGAHARLIGHLRAVYEAPEGEYILRDWAIGFEPVEVSNG